MAPRRRARRGHPTAIVLGVLTFFVAGAFALVLLGRDSSEPKATKQIAVTTTLPLVTTSSLGITSYTVKAGETMQVIAERFGTTVTEILDENELTDPDVLVAGQVLKIPPPRIPGLVVKPTTVVVGDIIEIRLTGAQAFEAVTFEIAGPTTSFTGPPHTTNKGGKFITSYQIAVEDVPGTYTVTARGDLGTTLQTTFVVEAAPAP
jgi:LysM repeat protein